MTIYITMIIMIIMFSAAWLTMPLTTLNVFFSKAYPMSVSPSIDFLLRWDHHLHHHHHNFFCLQFHRSNGVVHVHVWLCQAVQPPSLLKSADYLLNTGDYPGIHSQVSFRYIWWWYDDDDDDDLYIMVKCVCVCHEKVTKFVWPPPFQFFCPNFFLKYFSNLFL